MIHHLQEADKPCSKRSHFRSRGLCFKMSNAWHVISSFLGCFSFYGHTYIPFGHRHLSEELSHLTSLYRSKIQACFRQMFHRLAYHEFAIQLCVLLSWLQQQVPYIFRLYSVPITALKKFWKAMPTEVKIAIHDGTKYQKNVPHSIFIAVKRKPGQFSETFVGFLDTAKSYNQALKVT